MAQCQTPFGVRNKKTNQTINVPCGRCPACVARRASGWSFRLMQEDKRSSSAYFITLTYASKHLRRTNNNLPTIVKRDLQLFMKRLRKLNKNKLKYYACGEYGGRFKRPHYHIILFNADITTIGHAWELGYIHYGDVSAASIGYCLKYMSKKGMIPMFNRDDRTPEFALMSKGLGDNYLTKAMIQWHKKDLDNRMYLNIEDGKKIAMPRYYKDKIYQEHERKRVAFFQQKRITAEMFQKLQDNPDYYRDKAAADIAAFRRMRYSSSQNEVL